MTRPESLLAARPWHGHNQRESESMTDELDWYLSRSGPRATVTVVPDLGAGARPVAVWVYDPDRPRHATRAIAEMTRRTVAVALNAALQENPLLLSAKRRERQPTLPAAADARLVKLARKRHPTTGPASDTSPGKPPTGIVAADGASIAQIQRGLGRGAGLALTVELRFNRGQGCNNPRARIQVSPPNAISSQPRQGGPCPDLPRVWKRRGSG